MSDVLSARDHGPVERLVGHRRGDLAALCSQYCVRRLELFGSAVTGEDEPGKSDLDFLVEFDVLSAGYADRYFGLLEELERLFARPVDLVVSSTIINPYFRAGVERTKTLLYAA